MGFAIPQSGNRWRVSVWAIVRKMEDGCVYLEVGGNTQSTRIGILLITKQ